MNKLSEKTNIIIKLIEMFLSHDEIVLLINTLQQKYSLKQAPPAPPKREMPPPEMKPEEQPFPLEVVYSDGTKSNYKLYKKAIGVIIPGTKKLLYFDGSENIGTRSQARDYIRYLPKGYNWHLMRVNEALAIKNHLGNVNYTLKKINGLPIDSRNYMLEDDEQSKGYVRYVADL